MEKVLGSSVLSTKLDRMFPEDTVQQKISLPVVHSIIERGRGHAVRALDLLAPVTEWPTWVLYRRAQAG